MNEDHSGWDVARVQSQHHVKEPRPAFARALVAYVLDGQPDVIVGNVQLGVTELVANAYLHGVGMTREEFAGHFSPPYGVVLRVAVHRDERSDQWYVLLLVHDPNPERPDWGRKLSDSPATTGRGLALIRQEAAGFGSVACGTGKDVIAQYAIEPPCAS